MADEFGFEIDIPAEESENLFGTNPDLSTNNEELIAALMQIAGGGGHAFSAALAGGGEGGAGPSDQRRAKRAQQAFDAFYAAQQSNSSTQAYNRIKNSLANASRYIDLARAAGLITEEQAEIFREKLEEYRLQNERLNREIKNTEADVKELKDEIPALRSSLYETTRELGKAQGIQDTIEDSIERIDVIEQKGIVVNLDIPEDTLNMGRYLVYQDENGRPYVLVGDPNGQDNVTNQPKTIYYLDENEHPEAFESIDRQSEAGKMYGQNLDPTDARFYQTSWNYIRKIFERNGLGDELDDLQDDLNLLSEKQVDLIEAQKKLDQLKLDQEALDEKVRQFENDLENLTPETAERLAREIKEEQDRIERETNQVIIIFTQAREAITGARTAIDNSDLPGDVKALAYAYVAKKEQDLDEIKQNFFDNQVVIDASNTQLAQAYSGVFGEGKHALQGLIEKGNEFISVKLTLPEQAWSDELGDLEETRFYVVFEDGEGGYYIQDPDDPSNTYSFRKNEDGTIEHDPRLDPEEVEKAFGTIAGQKSEDEIFGNGHEQAVTDYNRFYEEWLQYCKDNGLEDLRGQIFRNASTLMEAEAKKADLMQKMDEIRADLEDLRYKVENNLITEADREKWEAELTEEMDKLRADINEYETSTIRAQSFYLNRDTREAIMNAHRARADQITVETNSEIIDAVLEDFESRHHLLIAIYTGDREDLPDSVRPTYATLAEAQANPITARNPETGTEMGVYRDPNTMDLYFYDAETNTRTYIQDPLLASSIKVRAEVRGEFFMNETRQGVDPNATYEMTREAAYTSYEMQESNSRTKTQAQVNAIQAEEEAKETLPDGQTMEEAEEQMREEIKEATQETIKNITKGASEAAETAKSAGNSLFNSIFTRASSKTEDPSETEAPKGPNNDTLPGSNMGA